MCKSTMNTIFLQVSEQDAPASLLARRHGPGACLGAAVQANALADLDQLANGVPQAVGEVVVAEDGGRAWVRQDVRVALVQVVPRERPVVQRGARVVVLRARAHAPGSGLGLGFLVGQQGWGTAWSPSHAPSCTGLMFARAV